MASILILTEAGGDLGYGHLTRCLAIAQELGSEADLLVQPGGEVKFDDIGRVVPWRDDLIGAISTGGCANPAAVLVDSYLADRSVLEKIGGSGCYLAVIDDYDRMQYPAELIINPAILGPELSFQNSKVVSGASWVILRSQIRAHPPKRQHGNLTRLLLTFGGADRKRLLDRLLPVLGDLEFEVMILAGSDERAAQLSLKLSGDRFKVFGRLGAKAIAELFTSSDLALSAGGQTLNELAYLGVPFLAIQTGKDQYWNINSYLQSGVTPYHFHGDDLLLDSKLLNQIEGLKSPSLRRDMASRGRGLIDGQGAKRIADVLRTAAAGMWR